MKAETLMIVKLLIEIVLIAMSAYVLPALREWLVEKAEISKKNKIKDWANVAVNAAEQVYNTVKKLDPTGTKRKEYAVEFLYGMCLKAGIRITKDEATVIIESAVKDANLFWHGRENEIRSMPRI